MAFAIVAALFFLALLTASFASGKYSWRWYAVPTALTLLYAVYMLYLIGSTSDCADCRNYQSGPEEVRKIGLEYGTAVLALSVGLWGTGHSIGRVIGAPKPSDPAPSR